MNFIRCGDISRFHFAILKVLTLREFLVFRQLWLYTNPERNCSDRKTDEERLTLSPRLQLFVTFCSVEPLYCALRLPSEISPAQSPRSFDVSSLFTYGLDVRFLEVSRALFFDTGPPYIYHLVSLQKIYLFFLFVVFSTTDRSTRKFLSYSSRCWLLTSLTPTVHPPIAGQRLK